MRLTDQDPDARPPLVEIFFAQFTNRLLASTSDVCQALYQACYPKMPGYHYQEDFLELPYWVNIVNGMLHPSTPRRLLVIDSVDDAISVISEQPAPVVMFSVMNVTEPHVRSIVSACDTAQFVLGGYTDTEAFATFRNVAYIRSPLDLPSVIPVPIDTNAPPDYSLFRDRGKWMPRITLSTGCVHQCRFCAVPRTLTLIDQKSVLSQARALDGLDFDLVYLDDKTFGQADNYALLREVRLLIKRFNPTFLGFVVQTTATALARNECALLKECVYDFGVRYFEIGLETCDDALLALLRKPQRMRHVEIVFSTLREINASMPEAEAARIIPNILFGIAGDDYVKTVDFIANNLDLIPTVNYANISAYPDRRDPSFLADSTDADGDDYRFDKSWLPSEQVASGERALAAIIRLFGVAVSELAS